MEASLVMHLGTTFQAAEALNHRSNHDRRMNRRMTLGDSDAEERA